MKKTKQGQWVTKQVLMGTHNWSKQQPQFKFCFCHAWTYFPIYGWKKYNLEILRQMVDRAWDWARSRKLWRKNRIHQEEEVCLVLDDGFAYSDEHGFETNQRATMEVQDYFSIYESPGPLL